MSLDAGKFFDPVIGIDLHNILTPAGVPVPAVPHPFTGIVFDPLGLAVGMAISAGVSAVFGGPFSGPVLINGVPAANTGTEVKAVPVHIPIGGTFVIPPSNEGSIITGSKTVDIMGSSAARLTSMVMTCSDPVNLPSSVVMAVPMGPPVFIGGPTGIDFMAAVLAGIRCKWVSDKLHDLLKAKPGSWRSKIICFFTGHPVDVATGRVLTDSTDLEIEGVIPFKFERNYYSASTYDGPLGIGWHHSYDQSISVRDDSIILRGEDGREIEFDYISGGESTYDPVERLRLSCREDGFDVRTLDRLVFRFGPQKRSDGALALVRIEDRNGHLIQLTYDAGILQTIIDSAGRTIRFIHDLDGRLRVVEASHPTQEDTRLAVLRFEYDEAGNLVAAYDALGHPYVYSYRDHVLIKETNRNGLSFHFEYDEYCASGKCLHTWGDNGIYDHRLTYDDATRITVVENSLKQKTLYFCTETGLVSRIVDPSGGARVLEWDECCNRIAETDPAGNTLHWKFNEEGRLATFTDEDGNSVTTTYDTFGNAIRLDLSDGNFLQRGYDRRGNVIWIENAMGGRKTFTYDSRGRMIRADYFGSVEHFVYNQRNELVEWKGADGGAVYFSYTPHGKLREYITPSGFRKQYEFDLNNRIIVIRHSDGTRRRYQYDPEGNFTRFVDASGYVTEYKYGHFDKCVERIEPTGHHLFYEYDTEGKLTALVNQRGDRHRFSHDAAGRLIEEETFDGVIRRYGYHGSAFATEVEEVSSEARDLQRPKSRILRFDRNGRGEIVKKILPSGEAHTFEYGAFGRLTKATTSLHELERQYSILGEILEETQDGLKIQYECDGHGRTTRRHSPFGRSIAYSYTSGGQLSGLESEMSAGRPIEIRFRYNLDNQLAEAFYPGSVRRLNQYDREGRLVSQTMSADGESSIQSYRYGDDGRPSAVIDNRWGTVHIEQDPGERLKRLATDQKIAVFEFDPAGNIMAAGSDRFRIGKGNRLLSKNGLAYRYNGFGDLIERPWQTPAGVTLQKLIYDDEHQLIRVEDADGQVLARFEYDACGRRVKKVLPDGKEVRYFWDQYELLGEDDGTTAREYLFDNFVPIAQVTVTKAYAYHCDALGTPHDVTDDEGRRVWFGRHGPYGNREIASGSMHQPLGLPGQYLDQETGLCYNLFRYYDPDAGRFLTHDPIGLAGGTNQYEYVSNPLATIDPLGLITWKKVSYHDGPSGTDLMGPVDQAYRTPGSGARPTGNVAVIEYGPPGTPPKVFASGGPHSEEKMLKWMKENNIDPNSVRRIYSELQPCDKAGHRCLQKLMDAFKDNKNLIVEFSFFYPEGYGEKKWAARERHGCS